MQGENNKVIIGITGGFGTGKTTVAAIFKTLGAAVLDADKIAHGTLKKGTASFTEILKVFGRGILNTDGKIDRAELAKLAFRSAKSLNRLCAIIHPPVIKKIKDSIKSLSRYRKIPAIVIDAPLLIEAGLHAAVDYVIVVRTSKATQIKRAMKKTRLSRKEAMKRLVSQMPLSKKIEIADYIIDNEGNKAELKKTVKKIWEGIKSGYK